MKVKKKGFTLVEIIVVVSSVGVIMMIVVGTILQTMKAQNRNDALSRLADEGNWILGELRRNIFNSNGKITCRDGNLSVGLTSLYDGTETVLSCETLTNNRIASTSGSIVRTLNATDINVINCVNFAICETTPDSDVSGVTFNFAIGTTVSGVGASQSFSTTLTVRN